MSTGRERELLARLESLIGEIDRISEQVGAEDAEIEAQRATAARCGDLGPDWQEVQRRVDAGETSLREVFGGVDDTPAAVRLRSAADPDVAAPARPAAVDEAPEAAETRVRRPARTRGR